MVRRLPHRFTLILLPLLPLLRRIPREISVLISGPWLFLTPWLFLWIMRATLFPIFGESHDIRQDWYLFPLFFAAFLFGFGIAKHQPFFDACVRHRWLALGWALASWAALQFAFTQFGDENPPADWLRVVFRGVREMQAWGFMVAAFGFAHLYLRGADGPLRRYFTEAIFPYYLVHQTLIVVVAYHLNALAWPLWIEAPLLIGATFAGCALTYEIARRVPLLRPWFGLKPIPKQSAAPIESAV